MRVFGGMLFTALLGLQAWTQLWAHRYGYDALLGHPWWQGHGTLHRYRLYAPWQGLVWRWHWGGIWWQVGIIAGGLCLVTLVVVSCRKTQWQGRQQPPPMTGHGSTQWATTRELRKAGLL